MVTKILLPSERTLCINRFSGNAETANFTQDIGLTKSDLNTAVAIFFAFFVALQPVGAALGRRYGMSIYVPTCMSIWGVCTALHVVVKSKWQLIILRMVIGALESGFYPVTVSYLSLFYTKFEFGRRLAVFYGQSAIAGAFGGILSYFVFSWFPNEKPLEDDTSAWRSWQVLFMVEGCATIILALTGFFWLPHNVSTAWFLKPDERSWAEERIKLDSMANAVKRYHAVSADEDVEQVGSHNREGEEGEGLLGGPSNGNGRIPRRGLDETATDDRGLSKQDLLSAFLDWKIWYLLICNILSAIPVTAFSVFLPLVLQPLTGPMLGDGSGDRTSDGTSDGVGDPRSRPALTNLLTAPPFILGAIVLYLFTSYSDRQRTRLYPILLGLGILLMGLTLTTLLPEAWVVPRYLSLCVLLSGSFIASPLQVAWLSNNIPQTGKRSVVLGINGWGNLAGVFSAWLFQPKFAPNYQIPLLATVGLVSGAWAGYSTFRLWIVMENGRRSREGVRPNASRNKSSLVEQLLSRMGFEQARSIVEKVREAEIADEEAIDFRYGL